MSDDRWTRDQKLSAVSIAIGTVGTTANFIQPITDAIGPFYWIIQPFLFLGMGLFIGYAVTRMLYNKKIGKKDEEREMAVAAKDAEIEKIRRDCERRVFEATMPLDRTIRLTKPQAEVVVGMIDRERAGEDTVLSARRGGDAALDSLAAQGVLHKEPFGSFHNMFNYAMDHEWLSLFRKHESEVRDIAAR